MVLGLPMPPDVSDTAEPVPRWALVSAYAVTWLVLPSSLWRVPVAFGFDMGMIDPGAGPWVWWALPYTFTLILVTEGLAFLTTGLVRRWGEVAPAWLPLIGGRPVRPLAAIVPATIGGLALTALWTSQLASIVGIGTQLGFTSVWWEVLAWSCYLPYLAWGPLLLAVTYAYARRRSSDR